MYGLRFRGAYPEAVAKELDAMLSALRAWLTVDHNEDGTHNLRPSGFDFVPIGALMQWGSDTPPDRWLICDGSPVSRTTYQGLFAVIGTTYGVGDGSTTFNVPDFRQRMPLGKSASGTGSTLGSTGGAIDHTHSIGSHSHTISSGGSHSHTGNTGSNGAHTHSVSGTTGGANTTEYGTVVGPGDGNGSAHTHNFSVTSNDPGNHAHSISSDGGHDHGGSTGSSSGTSGAENPPYQVVQFIILAGA